MLYSFLYGVTNVLLRTINGKMDIRNKSLLPKGNYILVAPHQTWLDPVLFAYACHPQEFGFVAKKELYKNKLFKYILNHTHGIPIDRKHPGISAITKTVHILQQGEVSIIIFPSGTRHSQKLKAGAALIAKMAKVPLVPAVYQGPLTFKELFTRKKTHIAFGKPITISPNYRLNNQGQQQIERKMSQVFKHLNNSINPHYHYRDATKKH